MVRRKKPFLYGGKDVPGIYEEQVTRNGKIDHIRYYFKNAKGNKVRAKEKGVILRLFNEYQSSIGEELVTLLDYKVQENWELIDESTPMDYEPGGKFYDPEYPDYDPQEYYQRYGLLKAVPRAFLLDEFRKMLEKDPKRMAQELGIEELAFLPKLKPRKQYTLRQIGNYYFYREKYTPKPPLTPQHLREAQLYWREFIKITGIKKIDEIEKTLLNQYNAELNKVIGDPQYRPTWLSSWQKKSIKDKHLTIKWVKVRLDNVKTILINAIKVAEYTRNIEEALVLCRKTFYHEQIPKTIVKYIFERKHIEVILEVLATPKTRRETTAYVKWKVVVLLALNCAFTPMDFTDLTFDDLDLKKGELSMIRKKKNTERYAVLWSRTVEALQAYLKVRTQPVINTDNHVFINQYGTVIKHDHLSDDFRRFLQKVNLLKGDVIPEGLTFKYFRKSAASSAERTPGANPSEVSYLLGHSAGIRQHYTLRAADLVGNVCRKIEQDFFGD